MAIILASCTEKGNPRNPAVDKHSASTETFVIALLSEQNVFLQKKRYAPLAEYPPHTLGMKSGQDAQLKERLKNTLLTMDKTAEGRAVLSTMGATHFIETRSSEFEPIREMLDTLSLKPGDFALDAIGITLKTGKEQ